MRLDRFASLYFFHPLASRWNSEGSIPILMYHSISNQEDHRHPYFQTTTSPQRFAEQMDLLKQDGYQPVRLSDVAGLLTARPAAATKPVVITFDDGYRNFYTDAYPVLAQYGFTASMFLPTAYICNDRRSFNGISCLNWKEVRELDAAGIEFGSHTVTHPKLKDLSVTEIEREVRESKQEMEDQIGSKVRCFSYPFAFPELRRSFVANLRDALCRSGYEFGVSTIIGTTDHTDDPLFMRRLPVNTADDRRLLRAKLEGGYNWLHRIQRWKKTLRSTGAR